MVAYSRSYGEMRGAALGKRGYFVQFEPSHVANGRSGRRVGPYPARHRGRGGAGHRPDDGRSEHRQRGEPARLPASSAPATWPPLLRSAGSLPSAWWSSPKPSAAIQHSTAVPGGTVAGQTNGVEAVTAILALNALVGHLGEAGSAFTLTPPAVDPMLAPTAVSSYARRAGAHRPDARRRRRRADGPGQSPARAAHRDSASSRRFPRCRSSCRSVPSPTRQALLSDMILPDHNYLESWGYQSVNPATTGRW